MFVCGSHENPSHEFATFFLYGTDAEDIIRKVKTSDPIIIFLLVFGLRFGHQNIIQFMRNVKNKIKSN